MEGKRGKIIIFSAPSGAGKTTIVHAVLQRIAFLEFSISATTRPKRPHEINGRDYYFLNEEKFRHYLDKGSFLEWEEVYRGKFYGTFFSEVERIITHGNSAVFDVDVKGGLNIKKYYGSEALSIFIMPPGKDALRTRLMARATESPQEIENRLQKAEAELSFSNQFDQVVVNDDLAIAVDKVERYILNFINE
jgi:guanylate kinase